MAIIIVLSRHDGLVYPSYVTVWSRTLRSEGVTPKDAEADAAETRARAAFGACVAAINAVDSLSYRFAKASQAHGWIQSTRARKPTRKFCVVVVWRGLRDVERQQAMAGCVVHQLTAATMRLARSCVPRAFFFFLVAIELVTLCNTLLPLSSRTRMLLPVSGIKDFFRGAAVHDQKGLKHGPRAVFPLFLGCS